jgi:hypothetical protein
MNMGRAVRAMMSRLPLLLVAALALSTVGCSVKVDATVTGPAAGSTDKVRVKVVGTGSSELTCSDGACEPTKIPYSGETTIDVKVPPGPAKVVTITVKKGIRRGSATIDLAAGGTGSTLKVEKGVITCIPTGCRGRIDIAPASKISLEAPAGSTIEVGGEKLTVPASGSLVSPLKLAISPSIEKQPLDKICTGSATSSNVLTSTTLTLTLPGKSPMTAKADLDMALAQQGLSLALVEVKKGAVVFPWEKPGEAAKGKRAAVYADGARCYDAGTTGATVADLDVIAVGDVETREDQCVYTLTKGGTVTGALTLYDRKATVYDRVTGRTLATKLFNAPKKCTKEITVRGNSTLTSRQTSFVDNDVIAKWAATFAK